MITLTASIFGQSEKEVFEASTMVPPISLDGLHMAVQLGTEPPPLLDVPPGTWQVTSGDTAS